MRLAPKLQSALNLALGASVYLIAAHISYRGYVSVSFEYAHYYYLPFSELALVLTYALVLLPLLAYRESQHPAQAAAALIFALAYVPIQLCTLFSLPIPYFDLLTMQVLLCSSMTALFWAARSGTPPPPHVFITFTGSDLYVGGLTLVSLLILLGVNLQHMRLVSFEDVYDLRMASADTTQGPLESYLLSWLTYCFISYFFARGLIGRKAIYLAIGLVAAVLVYMATGGKASMLLLPITALILYTWRRGAFLTRLTFGLGAIVLVMTTFFPDEGAWMWAKSIVMVRTIWSTGWVFARYYEFFPAEGFTYFGHIGPVNALTGLYPYGNLSLGQLIALEYSGTLDANFNASFWASDGIAALGLGGIVLITPAVMFLFYAINRTTSAIGHAFAVTWMVGFFIALLNVPLTTALLSGGGLLIMAFAWQIARSNTRSAQIVVTVQPR